MAAGESRKRKLEEYEMQLFGFHSRAVYATLRGVIQERIRGKVQKLCETLVKTYKPSPEELRIYERDQRRLERAYYRGAIPHLKSIETIVNKYIAVPSNVLSEEDKCQRVQYAEAEFEDMKEKLENLQLRAKRATILNAALKEELEILEQFSTFENDVNLMCNTVQCGLECPDVNNEMLQLVEDYKEFSANVVGGTPRTSKVLYNIIDGIKYKDCDLNSL